MSLRKEVTESMAMRRKRKGGQSTAEYAVLIGLVIAAVLAMQTYVKRGLQARMKDSSDVLSTVTNTIEGVGALKTDRNYQQFEPYYLSTSNQDTQRNQAVNRKEDRTEGGAADQLENALYNVTEKEDMLDEVQD